MPAFAEKSKRLQPVLDVTSTSVARQSAAPEKNQVLQLQRRIGNRALQRLLQGTIQTKLTVNEPGDDYEREADHVAQQVMSMRTPEVRRASIQRQQADGGTASEAVTQEIEATRGGGNPLPASSQTEMEDRFGADFSRVRIHTGDYAARLSRQLSAKAFTVGSDIYFSGGAFSPELSEGKFLLAHELTHTIQQGAAPSGQVGAQLMIQKADGDKANTAFGEFEAVKYHPLKKKSDGKEVGVEMFLRFNPGTNVDAKLIAMTQAATGKSGGTPATADPNYGRRSATSGAGKGEFIDVLVGYPSPLYATANAPRAGADASKLTSYDTVPSKALTPAEVTSTEASTGLTGETRTGFGKQGFRYTEAGKLKGPESAELYDSPNLNAANDSEQIFESTALAIDGNQKDTYYGSVTWGWKRDTAGKFSMIPFKAVSQGTPTANFLTAASVWNGATEDFNWGVNVASANILDTHDPTKTLAAVTRGTALTWGGAQGAVGGVTLRLVQVKDGPSTGTIGLINSAQMAMMDVGRQTVDLPIEDVQTINTASVAMVSDPAKAGTTVVANLPKDTRVTLAALGMSKAVLAGAFPDWAHVEVVDGPNTTKTGWVPKKSLTKEALGTR